MIIEIIKKLKALNKTILISSHIFSTLSEVCDEILLLRNGKIEMKATKQEGYQDLEDSMRQNTVGIKLDNLKLE